MAFIKNLCQDEIRDGYLVKTDKKKIWERQLEIWQEIDRICRKHKIAYWAGYGTLLGAARHSGFIPWDDDLDICIMRPEFNRFSKILQKELSAPFEIARNISSVIKISHSQTTLLASGNINANVPKGLIVDVFPLDVTFDDTKISFFAVNALNEILGTIYNYPAIVNHVKQGGKTVNDWSIIENLHAMTNPRDKYEFFNIFAEGVFDYSTKVDWIEQYVRKEKLMPQEKSWFRETIYLPFETLQLPAPIDYDAVLTSCYDDWRKYVIDKGSKLGFIHSPDIPYREFQEKVDLELMFPGDVKVIRH